MLLTVRLRMPLLCIKMMLCRHVIDATMAIVKLERVQKEKNFSQDKKLQLCKSVLHVSHDPIINNEQ